MGRLFHGGLRVFQEIPGNQLVVLLHVVFHNRTFGLPIATFPERRVGGLSTTIMVASGSTSTRAWHLVHLPPISGHYRMDFHHIHAS